MWPYSSLKKTNPFLPDDEIAITTKQLLDFARFDLPTAI